MTGEKAKTLIYNEDLINFVVQRSQPNSRSETGNLAVFDISVKKQVQFAARVRKSRVEPKCVKEGFGRLYYD